MPTPPDGESGVTSRSGQANRDVDPARDLREHDRSRPTDTSRRRMAGTVVWSGQFNNVADPIPATDCDRLWWRFPDPAEPGRRIVADLAARRQRQAPGWPGRADQKAH
jgi:hypothetical protein